MNSKKVTRVSIGIFGIFATIYLGTLVGSIIDPVEVEATGGAEIVSEMVMGKLNDALTYLNEGDQQAAIQEIQEAINELEDTYETDKSK